MFPMQDAFLAFFPYQLAYNKCEIDGRFYVMMKLCTDYTNMYLIQCTVMAPLTHAHLHFVKELNTI